MRAPLPAGETCCHPPAESLSYTAFVVSIDRNEAIQQMTSGNAEDEEYLMLKLPDHRPGSKARACFMRTSIALRHATRSSSSCPSGIAWLISMVLVPCNRAQMASPRRV